MRPALKRKSGEIELAVHAWGKKAGRPAVVLVHGQADNAEVWSAVAAFVNSVQEA